MILGGNWGWDYEKRIKVVISLLKELLIIDEFNKIDYNHDLQVAENELKPSDYPVDGRVFRDSCKLYNYSSSDGKTEKVRNFLNQVLTHPEYNNI